MYKPLYSDHHGFFHNFNNVIEATYETLNSDINIIPIWKNMNYGIGNKEKTNNNIFTYFFKHKMKVTVDEQTLLNTKSYPDTYFKQKSIIYPYFFIFNKMIGGLPNREKVNKIFNINFEINNEHIEYVEKNYKQLLNLVCIHIRGKGKQDDGIKYISEILKYNIPPLEKYFEIIDDFINKGEKEFYLATDDADIFNYACNKYPNIIFHNINKDSLISGGEYHFKFYPNSGTDLIREVIILSRGKHFVHGISNMANFILSMNPNMPSTDVYYQMRKYLINKG